MEKLAAVSIADAKNAANRARETACASKPSSARSRAAAAPRGTCPSQFGGSRHRSSFNLGADKERVWGIRSGRVNGDRGDHRIVVV